jgi:hypothetical protein
MKPAEHCELGSGGLFTTLIPRATSTIGEVLDRNAGVLENSAEQADGEISRVHRYDRSIAGFDGGARSNGNRAGESL